MCCYRKQALLLCLLLMPVAQAQAICNVLASNFNFGVYDPLIPMPHDVSGTLEVNCLADTLVRVTLDAGANAGGDVRRRALSDGGSNLLNYNIYIDPGHSLIFGDETAGSAAVIGTAGTNPVRAGLYGRIHAQQGVAPGVYSDVIMVTVDW